jgi:hypothetical protein
MRKTTAIAVLAGLGLAAGLATTADAHHAVNAQFDVTKSVVITGTLTKVDWQNPHAWFWFDVKQADGSTQKWGTETVGPNGLRRIGLSDRRLFVVGDTYQVELNPDRSGKYLGFTNAFKFPDGRYIKVGFIDANGNGIEPPAGVTGAPPVAGAAPAPRAGGGD